ncbi:hypothetical protein SODALDRAFT_354999 [Sodiomyces alkalinus F11]|uniref:Uncharacterized protein n=1 Tax=Sodiomyces alkalinus (strain CBS 110278 / VKM F-3762 / F11) TaxID=1314773 RepID=A0A3N2Q7S2_SODAK|nr:hypothetical protein SODALDRAFT_354999 [Sodiomyces alkalinus F11]ROT42810.1 hypothetical protein SODALDRAFT_354999 [Sodiomyces alkalinus F11]
MTSAVGSLLCVEVRLLVYEVLLPCTVLAMLLSLKELRHFRPTTRATGKLSLNGTYGVPSSASMRGDESNPAMSVPNI